MSRLTFLCLLVFSYFLGFSGSLFAQRDPADLVNPLVGTAQDGQTFPAVGMPFAMTQWTPQTRAGEAKCVAPYYAADDRIQGFRGSHFLSGSCTQDYGSVTLMPVTSVTKLDPAGRASSFLRKDEVARPYLYNVRLRDSKIDVSITGTERAGMMRFGFPSKSQQWIVIENNARAGGGKTQIDAVRQEIAGSNLVHRIYAGAGQSAGFSGYFVIRFDRPFSVGGTFNGMQRLPGQTGQISGPDSSGAYISFASGSNSVVTARIGTSFTSIEAARHNLDAEIPVGNFEEIVQRTHAAWTESLNRIKIGGNSPERATFYTALYHCLLVPRIYSDVDGAYPSFGGATHLEHAKGFTFYGDFSIWDTFRALHPLLTLIEPKREIDMVKSLIAMGQQGGFLPIYPAWNSYTSEMIGDHANAIIADAYAKGLRGFDVEEAFRLMKQNATITPPPNLYKDGRGRRALTSYLRLGYIPLEDPVLDAFHTREQVSRTLEYAYDDFLVAQMASWLGHTEDARIFLERSQNYRRIIDSETGFARGRHEDGRWETPFDPGKPSPGFTEGLPFQYTFFVPQDMKGLIELEHGPKAFVAKLDELFAHGYYNHGNEPSHHIAYLYDFAQAPAKAQFHVHEIMSTMYQNTPGGLAGNDDAGQMSAWYVMSALGFYAVTPGTTEYALGTPRFDQITVDLGENKTLHIQAPGAESGNFYVDKVNVKGLPISGNLLLHEQIQSGGNLSFQMSDHPSE